jgi:hypothetical protein
VLNTPDPICDLIETRSAQHLIPKRKLWSWVFTAILDKALRPEDMSLDTEIHHGGIRSTWEKLIKHELRGWEQHNHDPSHWSWIDNIRFSPADFDRWLKAAKFANRFPAHPKRRPGAKTDRERLKEYIDAAYPDGPPKSLSYRQIANQAAPTLGKVFHVRTVARALGRK